MWAPHQYFWKFCVDGSCWRSPQMPFWVTVMTVQPSLLNAASFSFHSHFSSPVTFVIQVLLVSGISEPDPDLGSWITSYKFTGLPSSQLRYMYLTNTRMTSKMPKSLPPSAKTVIKFLFSAWLQPPLSSHHWCGSKIHCRHFLLCMFS